MSLCRQSDVSMLPVVCCCSVAQSCPTLHDPMDRSTPGLHSTSADQTESMEGTEIGGLSLWVLSVLLPKPHPGLSAFFLGGKQKQKKECVPQAALYGVEATSSSCGKAEERERPARIRQAPSERRGRKLNSTQASPPHSCSGQARSLPLTHTQLPLTGVSDNLWSFPLVHSFTSPIFLEHLLYSRPGLGLGVQL